jgi:hypothetical protein
MSVRALLLLGTAIVSGSPLALSITVVTSSGAGSVTIPAGYSFYTGEAIGSGGTGFGNNTAANRAGGGGGQYASSNARIAVTPGNSIFYSVGAAGGGNDSWVNTTNAVPTLASTGCRARGGTNAASATAGIGSTAGAVGAVTRNGANGTTNTGAVGGGGSGYSTAASGTTAGTDTSNLSASIMGGGTGGPSLGAGTAPGGGGGSSATTGTNPAGSIGRVRIVFFGTNGTLFDFMPASIPVGGGLTRASSGTRINVSGTLVNEVSNVARFTYDGVSHALEGLLVEPSRTNLNGASEDLSNTTFNGAYHGTVTLASGTAPDSANTANLLQVTGSGNPCGVTSPPWSSTIPPNSIVAESCFLKAGNIQYIGIPYCVMTTGFTQVFDVTNGTLTEIGPGTPAGFIAASAKQVGNGWSRCVTQGQATPSGGDNNYYGEVLMGDSATGNTFSTSYGELLSQNVHNCLAWGMQLELLSSTTDRASSYIKSTGGSATTRSADVLTLTMPSGTYNITINRLSGATSLPGTVVSGNSYTVPVDVSPVQSVTIT